MENLFRGQKIVEAIHLELEIDAQLIIRGFQELQSLDAERGVYFLASQSLAQGLERVMKVVLFLSGNIQPGEMRRPFGHDLEKLWRRVKNSGCCEPVVDEVLDKELIILSKFNQNARYHYLSIMDGEEIAFNPQEEWEKLEDEHMLKCSISFMSLANGDEANKIIQRINCCHIIPLEKIVCTLCRALVRYQVREIGWSVPIAFQEFTKYNDYSYGKTDYSAWPKCLEHKDKPYKLTWLDTCLNFWSNLMGLQQEKTQIVYKNEFDGQWPFRDIQEVKVIKREYKSDTFYLIVINGHLCALNGKTSDKLHLPTPHKAGYAVVGHSTQSFLDLAMKL